MAQQARLRSSFIYLANAVNDLRGNWLVLAMVLGPLALASALCLLPDAINLQYRLAHTFEPAATSVAWTPVQTPYAPPTGVPVAPPFPWWATTILHALSGVIALVGVKLVVLCALKRIHAGERAVDALNEAAEVYRSSSRLLTPFLWVSFLQFLATGVGAVLLVVPGILAYVWLYFSQYALVFDGTRSWPALFRSREMMRGNFLGVATRIVIFLAFWSGLNSWAGGVFFAVSLLVGWIGLITGALWISIFTVDLLAVAVAYAAAAFLLAAAVRLYQDLGAVADQRTEQTVAPVLPPTAPLSSATIPG